jgi:CHAD domain-containing protein
MPEHPIPYALRHREPIGPGMVRILETMGRDARVLARQPESKLTDTIHDLRTLIKRLRAYLWFLRPILGKSRYRRANSELREAANRLGQVRDLYAVKTALVQAATPDTAQEDLQSLVEVSQAFAEETAEQGKAQAPIKEIADVIFHVTRKTRGILEQTAKGGPSARHRAKKAFRSTQKAKKKALSQKDPALAHEWRKKTKRLLYVLQLAHRIPHLKLADHLKKVDQLQKILGDHHDNVVAEEHLRRHRADIKSSGLPRTLHLLKKRRKFLLKDARRIWNAI